MNAEKKLVRRYPFFDPRKPASSAFLRVLFFLPTDKSLLLPLNYEIQRCNNRPRGKPVECLLITLLKPLFPAAVAEH